MSLRLLLLVACVLGSCASLPAPDLPTCDGLSRRPANPHGSALAPDTPLAAALTVVDLQGPPGGRA